MLKVVIVTDSGYGERAYENIKEKFETEFIELEAPHSILVDEVEIPEKKLEKIRSADLIITYTLHPDLTLELVEKVHKDVGWIIIGAWKGEGFKKQLLSFGNITVPETMCDLQENGNSVFDKFVSKFGRPKVKIDIEGSIIKDIRVLRCSPCGATKFVAEELKGETIKDLPIKAGLKVQHYPCRASKMRVFSDDECKKEMAAKIHSEAFEKAIREVLSNS